MINVHDADCLLHDMEALYTWGFKDACAEITPEMEAKAKQIIETAPEPERTPLKFLSPESKQILIDKTIETVHASKIWILPFEHGEWDESRNVLVMVTIDPETGNEHTDNDWVLWKALHDVLRGRKAGRITPWMTWDKILENYVPNLFLPKYIPDWTKK